MRRAKTNRECFRVRGSETPEKSRNGSGKSVKKLKKAGDTLNDVIMSKITTDINESELISKLKECATDITSLSIPKEIRYDYRYVSVDRISSVLVMVQELNNTSTNTTINMGASDLSEEFILNVVREMPQSSHLSMNYEPTVNFFESGELSFVFSEVLDGKTEYIGVSFLSFNTQIICNPQVIDKLGPESTFYKLISYLYSNTLDLDRFAQPIIEFITMSSTGYSTMPYILENSKVNIKSNYNDDLVEVDKKLVKYLNGKNAKGLVILNGDPGTGKTYYLRRLVDKVKGRPILFIPSNLAHIITEPEFLTFLMGYQNAVLFIEDAEPVLECRGDGVRSSSISNILNITEGMLSDVLNVSIIATFNCKMDDIDPALMRKGRLFMHYKFEKLCVEKSNELLKKLKFDYVTDEPMTIADIYNYGVSNGIENIQKKTSKIGYED